MSSPLLSHENGPVLTLTFNRPQAMNAFNPQLGQALQHALEDAALRTDLKVIVLRGAGGNYMAGGDVRFFAHTLQQSPEERRAFFEDLFNQVNPLMQRLWTMPQVVISAVEGNVAGIGWGFMLASDLTLATDTFRGQLAYGALGLTPDGGVSYLLPHKVGLARAQDWAFTNRPVLAPEALHTGLIREVVAADHLDTALQQLTQRVLASSQEAQQGTKRLLQEAVTPRYAAHLELEKESFCAQVMLPVFEKAVAAFCAKAG